MKRRGVYTTHFNRRLLASTLDAAGFTIQKEIGCGFLIPVLEKVLLRDRPKVSHETIDRTVSILDVLPKYFPFCASSLIVLAQVIKQ